MMKHLSDYWLNDFSFVTLLIALIFTVFVLPVLIEYGHVSLLFVNLVFLFLFFTGIFSSMNRFLVFFMTNISFKFVIQT